MKNRFSLNVKPVKKRKYVIYLPPAIRYFSGRAERMNRSALWNAPYEREK